VILKIVLGKGGRGLLSYLSQIQKAPIHHHPQNNPKIYDHLQLTDPDWYPTRGNKPAAGINQLPNLSFLNVAVNVRPNAAEHRIRQGLREVFLSGDALHDLVGGGAVDADGLRRPGDRPGPTSTEKRGGRKLEKQSAPPTFSNFAGTTPKAIAAEFGALRKLKPNLGKAVAHLILSPGPEDRALSKDEWKRALDLALAEHGAGDALHAAYLHEDTDHPHLHCFFSRITPAGQVISDSNSYQKNRSASLKITQELQLTPLTNTPSPQAPGDRQALQNASRRAERNGTPGPEKINVQAVREALGKAATTDDYVRLNLEIGNEIEYLRRGEKQEIYGCKIRRIGSTEWVKMSTLAKDLSWPKIAHRFVETDSAKQVQADQVNVEGPTAAPTVRPTRDKYARAPGALRQILREGNSANQMPMGVRPSRQFSDRLPGINMKKAVERIGDLNIGVAAQAMLILGAAAANLGIIALKCLLNFLQRLLALFGIGLRPISQNISGGEQNVLGYEPYIEAEMCLVEDPIGKAAELILQTADAIKDPATAAERLPAGEGRSELIEAINNEALQKENVAAEANPLDDIFCADMEAQTVLAPEPAQSVAATTAPAVAQKSLWVCFIESVEQHKAAVAAVARASEKDLPIYFDDRSKAWRQRDDAEAGLQKLEADFSTWKNAHRVAAALGADPHSYGQKIVGQKKLVVHVAKMVAEAEKKDRDATALWKTTPAPVVPAALLDKEKATIAALRESRILLIAKANQNLRIISGNPMLKPQADALTLKLQRLGGRFDAFLVDPKTQPKIVSDLEPVLREIHLAVALERARLAPAPDAEPIDPHAPRA
jgi:hypothetical protein